MKYMPNDQRSQYKNRYEAKFSHSHIFSDKLTGGVSLHRMSDDDYQRNFYNTTSSVNLEKSGVVRLSHAVFGQHTERQFNGLDYQTLPDSSGNTDKPYAILPKLSANWQKIMVSRNTISTTKSHVLTTKINKAVREWL